VEGSALGAVFDAVRDFAARIKDCQNAATLQYWFSNTVLPALGWQTFDMLFDYRPERGPSVKIPLLLKTHADCAALFFRDPAKSLLCSQLERLIRAADYIPTRILLATNGFQWLVLDPAAEGTTQQKIAYDVPISNPLRLAEVLQQTLSKERVASGEATRNIISAIKRRNRQNRLLPALRKILLEQPDTEVLRSIADALAEVGVSDVEEDEVAAALKQLLTPPSKTVRRTTRPDRPPRRQETDPTLPPYYARPTQIRIGDEVFRVRSWKDVLVNVVEWLGRRHDLTEAAEQIRGKTRRYLAKRPDGMRYPRSVVDGQWFLETNFSCRSVVEISRRLMQFFGYAPDFLAIEWQS